MTQPVASAATSRWPTRTSRQRPTPPTRGVARGPRDGPRGRELAVTIGPSVAPESGRARRQAVRGAGGDGDRDRIDRGRVERPRGPRRPRGAHGVDPRARDPPADRRHRRLRRRQAERLPRPRGPSTPGRGRGRRLRDRAGDLRPPLASSAMRARAGRPSSSSRTSSAPDLNPIEIGHAIAAIVEARKDLTHAADRDLDRQGPLVGDERPPAARDGPGGPGGRPRGQGVGDARPGDRRRRRRPPGGAPRARRQERLSAKARRIQAKRVKDDAKRIRDGMPKSSAHAEAIAMLGRSPIATRRSIAVEAAAATARRSSLRAVSTGTTTRRTATSTP
jgi:hypothetical protein